MGSGIKHYTPICSPLKEPFHHATFQGGGGNGVLRQSNACFILWRHPLSLHMLVIMQSGGKKETFCKACLPVPPLLGALLCSPEESIKKVEMVGEDTSQGTARYL